MFTTIKYVALIFIVVIAVWSWLSIIIEEPRNAQNSLLSLGIITASLCIYALTIEKNTPATHKAVAYTQQIDSVYEDNHSIIYTIDGQECILRERDCEVIILSDPSMAVATPPYLQCERTVSYETIDFFGKVIYSNPKTKERYRFYVLKDYLNKPEEKEYNWTPLFTTTSPE